jgi:hypothetical protein
MILRSLLKRLAVSLLIFAFQISNLASVPSTAFADRSRKQDGTLIGKVERISIDNLGNLLRLSSSENIVNANPANPQQIGVMSGVAANSRYAYFVNHVYFSGSRVAGLWIVDFFAPDGPELMGFLNIDLANDVAVRGNYAYIVSGLNWFSHFMSIVDVSNPTTPRLVSTVTLSGMGTDVYLEGNYAYVSMEWGDANFQIINISNPLLPSIVGSLFTHGSGAASVTEHENIAYVVDNAYLMSLDVTNPSSPEVINVLLLRDDASSVRFKKNVIFETANTIGGPGIVNFIDTTEPGAPIIINRYTLPEANANDLWLLGNYGFVANDVAGLRILDLSDLLNPVTLDIFDTPDTALDLAVAGNYLYLADGSSLYMITLDLYSVSGRVEGLDGNPLNNFLVAAGSTSDNLTDIHGKYTLDGLPEGDYSIGAMQIGYHTLSPDILVHVPPDAIAPDITVDVNFLQGIVRAANLRPESDVLVDASGGKIGYTDTKGRYMIDELPEQASTIVPSKSPWIFVPESVSITVPPFHQYQISGSYTKSIQLVRSASDILPGNTGADTNQFAHDVISKP